MSWPEALAAIFAVGVIGMTAMVATVHERNEPHEDPVFVIFDGPPGAGGGPRIVGIEDEDGDELAIGEWSRDPHALDRGPNVVGLWRLRIDR